MWWENEWGGLQLLQGGKRWKRMDEGVGKGKWAG